MSMGLRAGLRPAELRYDALRHVTWPNFPRNLGTANRSRALDRILESLGEYSSSKLCQISVYLLSEVFIKITNVLVTFQGVNECSFMSFQRCCVLSRCQLRNGGSDRILEQLKKTIVCVLECSWESTYSRFSFSAAIYSISQSIIIIVAADNDLKTFMT